MFALFTIRVGRILTILIPISVAEKIIITKNVSSHIAILFQLVFLLQLAKSIGYFHFAYILLNRAHETASSQLKFIIYSIQCNAQFQTDSMKCTAFFFL